MIALKLICLATVWKMFDCTNIAKHSVSIFNQNQPVYFYYNYIFFNKKLKYILRFPFFNTKCFQKQQKKMTNTVKKEHDTCNILY